MPTPPSSPPAAPRPPVTGPAPSQAELRSRLHGLPGVDAVGLEQRASGLATRSIKTTAKAYALDLAISMVDLTTLEGSDTAGKVRALCAKAARPDPGDPTTPHTAAVCVYPDLAATAKEALAAAGAPQVEVAAVATAFPSGRASLRVKIADAEDAVAAGADEVDMVIDRGAFLSGDYLKVHEEIRAVKEACAAGPGGGARLKVIFENAELATYDNIRRASWLAMEAGADFIKTSTGKVGGAATLPATLLMLEAVRGYHAATGTRVGVKPAGGIRAAKDALRYLVVVNEAAGPEWLTPDWFRFGASGLLGDLLMQRHKLATGAYSGAAYVTVD
ncbi:deoxyribose-phosphate aldolase [Streptomyces xiaopingdaonensis]|uniref:deoxyribose-phosphate aldolase n=1 Tax=Streptomyces xiaopingdaonensis TaxID=1565415 RepID=UPI0002E6984A|nr:deoxyribose-phosphate aldolase [Streptomyces xiaopingdaonensis]